VSYGQGWGSNVCDKFLVSRPDIANLAYSEEQQAETQLKVILQQFMLLFFRERNCKIFHGLIMVFTTLFLFVFGKI